MSSACLPRTPHVAYLCLVRRMSVGRITVCLVAVAGISASGWLRAQDNATPESLLRDMLAAYERVTTYSDTGMLTATKNSDLIVTSQLKTLFARPHYFRLEWSRPPDQVTVVWSDGETHRVWESNPGVV